MLKRITIQWFIALVPIFSFSTFATESRSLLPTPASTPAHSLCDDSEYEDDSMLEIDVSGFEELILKAKMIQKKSSPSILTRTITPHDQLVRQHTVAKVAHLLESLMRTAIRATPHTLFQLENSEFVCFILETVAQIIPCQVFQAVNHIHEHDTLYQELRSLSEQILALIPQIKQIKPYSVHNLHFAAASLRHFSWLQSLFADPELAKIPASETKSIFEFVFRKAQLNEMNSKLMSSEHLKPHGEVRQFSDGLLLFFILAEDDTTHDIVMYRRFVREVWSHLSKKTDRRSVSTALKDVYEMFIIGQCCLELKPDTKEALSKAYQNFSEDDIDLNAFIDAFEPVIQESLLHIKDSAEFKTFLRPPLTPEEIAQRRADVERFLELERILTNTFFVQ